MTLANTLKTEATSIGRLFTRPYRILSRYRAEDTRPDLIAGLTVAIIMLPQAIAFAVIADLPLQMGLYAAIIGSILAGLFGSSSHLQIGPANTYSILTLSAVLVVASPGTPEYIAAAGVLAVLTGLLHLIMGVAHLGILVNFVSDSVTIGFTAGASALIIVNQLRPWLRVDIPASPNVYQTLENVVRRLHETHLISFLLGAGTMLLILALQRYKPKWPGPLLALLLSATLTALLRLDQAGVTVVNQIPSALPTLSDLSRFDLTMARNLLPGAVAMTIIGLVQTMAITRSVSSKTHQKIHSDQEFVGLGIANVAAGMFTGIAVTGSFVRTAINYNAGARTSISNVFAGLFVLLGALLLAPGARYIPMASLAGVLILASFKLVDLPEIKKIWRGGHGDRLVMSATFIATLIFPLEYAVLLGVALSISHYLMKKSTPRVRSVVPDQNFDLLVPEDGLAACPQFAIIDIMGDLYFGAVDHIDRFITEHREKHPDQRFLLLRIQRMEHCDISGIHALESIVKTYRAIGGDVFISRSQAYVQEVMRSTGFIDTLGEDHFLGREFDAIEHMFTKVADPAICIYECPVRVFKECQTLAKRTDLIGAHPLTHPGSHLAPSVAPKALWNELHSDHPPLIIDVREPREYKRSRIPGAVNIALPNLLEDPNQLDADREMVLVCRGGRRSGRAAAMLNDLGFSSVRVLEKGMVNWESANLLVEVELGGS